MPPQFSTRFVSENEADIFTKIHEECFPKYWDREAFTNFFEVQNTFAVLVESGDEPAGMMVYRVAFEDAEIITLAVRPSFRKNGLAEKMLSDALAHCKKIGAEKMLLEVEDGNIAAIKLYEKAGFTHEGRRKLYYQQLNGSLTDALVMRRKLG